MDTQSPQPGESISESTRLMATSPNASLTGKQQQCRHQLVHHDGANATTQNMTQDAHLKIVRKTRSSKNRKQHAIGCEYIHIEVNGHQLTVSRTTGIGRELCDQCIAVRNSKPPLSTTAFVRTVCKFKHHDVVSSLIFTDEFRDNHPQQWNKQALIRLEEATDAYMVELIAEYYC